MTWVERARLYASSDSQLRDGGQAVTDATRACELTDWKNAFALAGLAAAYAEAGQFEDAVRWQTKAIERLPEPSEEIKADYVARLKLYSAGKPYREITPPGK
jgi:serine/threonine-protein kinase